MSKSDSLVQVWHYWLLWIVALVSLGMNLLLVGTLLYFRQQAGKVVAQTAEALNEVTLDNFEYTVEIDETLPVEMTVPFSDTFVVPINTTVPVDTTIPFEDTIVVPINTTIPVNTTVSVPVVIPVIGTVVELQIPIATNIPVNLTVDVPISREIPIQLEIPVNLEVEVPVESEIPIQTEVPVVLDIPIEISLRDTPLAEILVQAQEAVNELARLLGVEVGGEDNLLLAPPSALALAFVWRRGDRAKNGEGRIKQARL